MTDRRLRLVVSIYAHPELYPPTLNAVQALSAIAENIQLVYLNTRQSHWHYPQNVVAVPSGKPEVVNYLASASLPVKLKSFYRYVRQLRRTVQQQQPHYLLAYDTMALYAATLAVKGLSNKPRLWYHNHDVNEPESMRRFSLMWLAQRAEKKAFPKLSIFSLPSMERLRFFDMNAFTGRFFFLPNYPSLAVFGALQPANKPVDAIKLIYQGSISDEHGLEEIIDALPHCQQRTELFIIGFGSDAYKEKLRALSQTSGVADRVTIHPPVPYAQLVRTSVNHHIGIAINIPKNIIYSTGGTASNKIYEYAACGLPVLYFDAPQYTQHLGAYKWALPCNLQREGIIKQVTFLCRHFEELSGLAKKDFQEQLHYEKIVAPVIQFLSGHTQTLPTHGAAH